MNFDTKKSGTKSFSCEIKASIYLSQWVKRICGAQSLKEKRLFCEFVFISIDRWTLTLNIAQRDHFLMNPKHQFIYPNG